MSSLSTEVWSVFDEKTVIAWYWLEYPLIYWEILQATGSFLIRQTSAYCLRPSPHTLENSSTALWESLWDLIIKQVHQWTLLVHNCFLPPSIHVLWELSRMHAPAFEPCILNRPISGLEDESQDMIEGTSINGFASDKSWALQSTSYWF